MRTGLPSFIVTLAFLFILRGFTIFFPQTDREQDHHRRHRDAAEGDWLAPLSAARSWAGLVPGWPISA
jgi:simple sugar transport system permease protein